MNKKEMIDAIIDAMSEQEGKRAISRLQVESVIEAFCGVSASELLGGGSVTLQGIGKIKTVATKARIGHNPRTGKPLQIPAGKRVAFSPFREFKAALKSDREA